MQVNVVSVHSQAHALISTSLGRACHTLNMISMLRVRCAMPWLTIVACANRLEIHDIRVAACWGSGWKP